MGLCLSLLLQRTAYLQAVEYNKLADDTSLHIKYTAVTAVEFSNAAAHFGKW